MSNPKSVVTEERLREFYGSILPYLGGMPEMVANKFSKGDLYSTEEKMIGQWIDGKPLYAKTFYISSLPNNTTADYTLDVSNVEYIAEVTGVARVYDSVTNENIIRPLPYIASSSIGLWTDTKNGVTVATISANSDRHDHEAYIMLKYTKTTDTAISIGNDTDYSTEEKIVGTWIDGKPLYQKTINFGVLPNATTKEVAHNISNLGHVVDIRGTSYTSTGTFMPLPLMYPSNETVNDTMIQVFSDKIIMKNLADRSVYSAYITLQYTKTTD